MSGPCGNCSCADKTQCVKKGNNYGIDIIETEKSYIETVVMDVAAKNNCECKCGPGRSCTPIKEYKTRIIM